MRLIKQAVFIMLLTSALSAAQNEIEPKIGTKDCPVLCEVGLFNAPKVTGNQVIK